nr:hypothetical protein [Rhodococcus sp. ACS1]
MQQHAAGGFVDVFGRGDQLGAGLLDRHVDFNVVGPVAGQAVDLMDDHVVDVIVLDVGEHPLQFGPVCCFGAFTALDKLFHDDCAERRRFLAVGFALGGQ